MIHLVDLPSLSSLKAWMHSGATETLGVEGVSWVRLGEGGWGGGGRTRMLPVSHVSYSFPILFSIQTYHDVLLS